MSTERVRSLVSSTLIVVALMGLIAWTGSAQAQKHLAPGRLRGDHSEKKIACKKCHVPFIGVPDTKCTKCHKRVIRQQNEKKGKHAGMIGRCANCHMMHRGTPGRTTQVDADSLNHSLVGFSLKGHKRASCEDCHQKRTKRNRINNNCVYCHEGRARRKTARFICHKKAVGKNCLLCHSGVNIKKFKHKAGAGFFVGKHAIKKCKKCHKNGRYDQDSEKCVGCHKNPHTAGAGDDCLECHNKKRWKNVVFEHDVTEEDCSECHKTPRGHFKGMCGKCHRTISSWRTGIKHPRIEDHTFRQFPCSYCHPKLKDSVDCRRCHKKRYPKDD